MLKSLRRGERLGSIGVVAGLLALVLVGVTLLGAVLWQASKFRDFRNLVASRCEAGQLRDLAAIATAEGDVKFYDDLLGVADKTARMPGLTDMQRDNLAAQRQIISDARDRKRVFIKAGVRGNCSVYR